MKTSEDEPTDGVLRRTVVKAGAFGVGAFGLIVPATGTEHDDEDDGNEDDEETEDGETGDEEDDEDEEAVDEPDGFEVEVLAPHAPFRDDLSARFCLEYADEHDGDPLVVELDDASTSIVARATWTEGGTSGWHRHPGISLVTMVEGEIEVTMEHDCVPRTYAAGDAWLDPGHVHNADSEGGATAYVNFLGIPDGEPATEWVPPVEC
ncbi:cupin domain-containing protein [Natronorarus salvus]|uniref:cupin domain-containing protein n=1 Tax=Natronorarus salvus TaxID=3117733 RepID=UPI002F267091